MRNKGLDFLRGMAILLVLLRHSNISNKVTQFGWLGVDLFFVLSGFLISSLLFTEYRRNQAVNIKRFLARRAFKIFPPFYFFLFISVALNFILTGEFYPLSNLLSEVFYLQSYLPGIAFHSWSLAVEEHFYLLFSFLLYISVKYKTIQKTTAVLLFLTGLLFLSFVLRFTYSYNHRYETVFAFTQSHLRMDGIVTGVLLSYLYHFTSFYEKIIKKSRYLFLLSLFLILPGFIFHGGSFYMNTIGLTTVNLGFGVICMLFIQPGTTQSIVQVKPLSHIFTLTAFIGVHSYSIYLWHLIAKQMLNTFDLGYTTFFICYLLLALLLGIALSYIIEKPFLKLRDTIPSLKKPESTY